MNEAMRRAIMQQRARRVSPPARALLTVMRDDPTGGKLGEILEDLPGGDELETLAGYLDELYRAELVAVGPTGRTHVYRGRL